MIKKKAEAFRRSETAEIARQFPANPELLAPGGSYEAVMAAYSAGADAVYTAGKQFGARAYADNMTEEELLELIDFAHLQGKRLYLTVNTLLKDDEIEDMLYRYLLPLYERGLDAVIVQDFGVLDFIHRAFPEMSLHASTQMGVMSSYGASMLAEYGVTRIITPRELSLEETRRLYEETGLEIESFVHGALCYSYSGMCLMSSLIGGRSGNRGRCAQPCRLPYRLCAREETRELLRGRETAGAASKCPANAAERGKEAYFLSMKDLCALPLLPRLLEAGIASLKIEGRMKKAEYTAGVVSIYRKYLDTALELYRQGRLAEYHVSDEDSALLLRLFSRNGFTQGYWTQQNGRDMLMLSERAAADDKQELFEALRRKYMEQPFKREASAVLTLALNEPASLTLASGTHSVCCISEETVQEAVKQPLSYEGVLGKLNRFGNTPFCTEPEHISIRLGDNLFFSAHSLNALRQNAVTALTEQILRDYRRRTPEPENLERPGRVRSEGGKRSFTKPLLFVRVCSWEQLYAAAESEYISGIYLSDKLMPPASEGWQRIQRQLGALREKGIRCYWELPYLFRERAVRLYERILPELLRLPLAGFLLHSLDELGYMRKQLTESGFAQYEWVADTSFYTMNEYARQWITRCGVTQTTFPYELNRRELRAAGYRGEMVIYGSIPMMVSAQCITKTACGCCGRRDEPASGFSAYEVIDRKNNHMGVENDCRYCYNILYNAKKLRLLSELPEIAEFAAVVRLHFTDESAKTCRQVISEALRYLEGSSDNQAQKHKPEGNGSGNTRGHYKRGVE